MTPAAAYLAGVAVGLGTAVLLLALAEGWARRGINRAFPKTPAPAARLDVRA